ncbi:MAG: hypothetical protein IPK03_03270 [Bacteroidetes bacterium]|nr:hypothetical protein [Bacteroidota bacterium]
MRIKLADVYQTQSIVNYNVGNGTIINVPLDGETGKPLCEFESIVRDITPLLEGELIEDLSDSPITIWGEASNLDIVFFTNELGYSREQIESVIGAYKLNNVVSELSKQFFYALLRSSIPTRTAVVPYIGDVESIYYTNQEYLHTTGVLAALDDYSLEEIENILILAFEGNYIYASNPTTQVEDWLEAWEARKLTEVSFNENKKDIINAVLSFASLRTEVVDPFISVFNNYTINSGSTILEYMNANISVPLLTTEWDDVSTILKVNNYFDNKIQITEAFIDQLTIENHGDIKALALNSNEEIFDILTDE